MSTHIERDAPQLDAVPVARERRPLLARSADRLREHGSDIVWSVVVLVGVLCVWQGLSTWVFSPIVLPSATSVGDATVRLITAPWFPPHVWATVSATVAGFAIAMGGAVVLASILHFFVRARRIAYPYIITLQLMPSIVLAPIFIIWFGFGSTSKVMLAAVTCFFVVLVSALAGFDAVDRDSVDLMRSLVATRRQIFLMLTTRTALPFIFAGLKTGITMALIGVLVAEFISARQGLGTLLTQFAFSLQQPFVFATMFVTVGLGLIGFGLITLLEKKIVWWRK